MHGLSKAAMYVRALAPWQRVRGRVAAVMFMQTIRFKAVAWPAPCCASQEGVTPCPGGYVRQGAACGGVGLCDARLVRVREQRNASVLVKCKCWTRHVLMLRACTHDGVQGEVCDGEARAAWPWQPRVTWRRCAV